MPITRRMLSDAGEHTFDSITASGEAIPYGYYLTATGHPLRSIASSYGMTIEENVGTSESLVDIFNAIRTSEDPLSLSDIQNRIAEYTRTYSEGVGIYGHIYIYIAKLILNSIGITDTIQVRPGRSFIDSIGFTDAVVIIAAYQRAITDNLNITDTIKKYIGKTLTATIGLTDSLTDIAVYNKTLADILGLVDNVGKMYNSSRTKTDNVTLTDSKSFIKSFSRTIIERIGIGTTLCINGVPISQPATTELEVLITEITTPTALTGLSILITEL